MPAVRGKREEVRVLKEEYGRTNELYETRWTVSVRRV